MNYQEQVYKFISITDKLFNAMVQGTGRTPCNDSPEALAKYLNIPLDLIKDYQEAREYFRLKQKKNDVNTTSGNSEAEALFI